MADDNVYEPGPSFVEYDPASERLTDMPAWLQTFAAQQIEADEEASFDTPQQVDEVVSPSSQAESPARIAASDMSLPDWLREDSVRAPQQAATDIGLLEDFDNFEDPSVTNPDSFISEDDLPDWLRAFSEESPSAPSIRSQAPEPMMASRSVPGSTTMVRVPPVENIWLSTYERQALGPGPSLFALLASNTNGSANHDAPAQTPAYTTGSGSSSEGSSDTAPVRQPVASGPSTPEVEEPGNSRRLLLLTLLVVALVILISFMFFR